MIFDLIVLALIGGLIWALINHKITINQIETDFNRAYGEIDQAIAKLESKVK